MRRAMLTLRPIRTHITGTLLILIVLLAAAFPVDVHAGPDGPMTPRIYLPHVRVAPKGYTCPATSGRQYTAIPVDSPPTDRPADRHADLNLAMRGSERLTAPLVLINYNSGLPDNFAPQVAGVFARPRLPALVSSYQVYDWNWACGPDGCRGALLPSYPYPVTLLGLGSLAGETLNAPSTGREIYGGGFIALVLYAEPNRITLKYTREDNVVHGYTVHFENVCVDPNLLAAYRYWNSAGRGQLPALRNGEPFGTALGGESRIAIRDNGQFQDPRSRLAWWHGY